MDLLSLPINKHVDLDGEKKVEFFLDLHEWVGWTSKGGLNDMLLKLTKGKKENCF